MVGVTPMRPSILRLSLVLKNAEGPLVGMRIIPNKVIDEATILSEDTNLGGNDDALSDFNDEDKSLISDAPGFTAEQKTEVLEAINQALGRTPQPAPPPPPRGRGRPPKIQQQQQQQQLQQPTLQAQQSLPPPVQETSARPTLQVPVVAGQAEAPPVPPTFPPDMVAPPPLPPCPWFDPNKISQAEQSALSVSFPALRNAPHEGNPNDRNLVAYLQLRNTLIDIYRANPTQRLTLAECRKHCDGDLAALIRMVSFLERNRLINYALDPALTNAMAPTGPDPTTKKLADDLRDHWTKTPTCVSCDRICLYSFFVLSPSAYGSTVLLPHLRTAVWCADCAREAPHNHCLLKVNLPALHVSGLGTSWSDQQISVLFDAIETHGPDWISIAKVVSTVPGNPVRTPRECLAAFLSMPIAEPSL